MKERNEDLVWGFVRGIDCKLKQRDDRLSIVFNQVIQARKVNSSTLKMWMVDCDLREIMSNKEWQDAIKKVIVSLTPCHVVLFMYSSEGYAIRYSTGGFMEVDINVVDALDKVS